MKYKISIAGMHCSSCASNIERSLRKIDGVKEASVSLMTNKGIINCDKKIDEEDVKKAVSRAGGYKAVKIEED